MLLLMLTLLAACTAPESVQEAPDRVVEPRAFDGNAPRGDTRLRAAMIERHNAARAAVGMPPLAWDAALARDAEGYARELARRGVMEHAPQPVGPAAQGENLWTGTRGAYRYGEMAQHWIDERRNFLNQPIPNISRTGRFVEAGHYSQIVWQGTTRVGCALASNRTDDYLVCRYSPAGNVWGQRALP
ncbi:CAP domain-containing protein [Sphingomonas sp.]|uniref:CAP domain-containing protein n=1 Tax=Sphingomonas sp. TaxID=28214 RepID=UPI00260150D1|nr:CAP domain-containing protein [Sphingomonas sp.]